MADEGLEAVFLVAHVKGDRPGMLRRRGARK
jgi:hypothetical protein